MSVSSTNRISRKWYNEKVTFCNQQEILNILPYTTCRFRSISNVFLLYLNIFKTRTKVLHVKLIPATFTNYCQFIICIVGPWVNNWFVNKKISHLVIDEIGTASILLCVYIDIISISACSGEGALLLPKI